MPEIGEKGRGKGDGGTRRNGDKEIRRQGVVNQVSKFSNL
jgi:hypothetical protein